MKTITIPSDIKTALETGADLAISVSGGKDSDAMATLLVALHRDQHYTGKLILIHAHLGRNEWSQTLPHLHNLSARLDVPLQVVERSQGDLIAEWEKRHETRPEVPPWSSAVNRFCTSDQKTSQCDKFLRAWCPDGTVICAIGIRAQESSGRDKKPICQERKNIHTRDRQALTWNAIIDFTLDDVWDVLGTSQSEIEAGRRGEIPASQFNVHPAYLLGNERLSCTLCILASVNDLKNGAEHNPDHYRQLVDLEIKSGFSFRMNFWLADLRPDLLTDQQKTAYTTMRTNLLESGYAQPF